MGGEIAKEKESPTKSMRGESNKLSNHECTDRSLGNEVPPIGSTDSRSLPNLGSEGLQPLESHFSLEGQAFEGNPADSRSPRQWCWEITARDFALIHADVS